MTFSPFAPFKVAPLASFNSLGKRSLKFPPSEDFTTNLISFESFPPFQIDGNFGCTSGITEMLMQSDDGAIHLLPALPDVWPSGSISGLKARGGFEIMEMVWKDSKLIKLVVKSSLGGNLRLRLPNELKLANGATLKGAKGENVNPFYFLNETAKPIISEKASIKAPILAVTKLYDIATQKGQIITLSL